MCFDRKNRLRSERLPLPRACISILPPTEKKYMALGMQVDFAKKNQKAQLDGLLTKDGLRATMERKNHYALGKLLPFVAALIERSTDSVNRCGFTRMHVLYTEILNKVPFDQRGGAWMQGELARLRSETGKLKSLVEKKFEPLFSSSLFPPRFHILGRHVDDLERFGCSSVMNARPFKQFNVLIKKCYRTKSQRRVKSLKMIIKFKISSGTSVVLPVCSTTEGRDERFREQRLFSGMFWFFSVCFLPLFLSLLLQSRVAIRLNNPFCSLDDPGPAILTYASGRSLLTRKIGFWYQPQLRLPSGRSCGESSGQSA